MGRPSSSVLFTLAMAASASSLVLNRTVPKPLREGGGGAHKQVGWGWGVSRVCAMQDREGWVAAGALGRPSSCQANRQQSGVCLAN